ncbi:M48 family metallopeptidase [Fodinisporobacter ferrooxydans]|uniref:M48 family metallopeptidase n=1 Tax=Fodinisporobacter ferrooxydans TaxID=2901836 RepID=A0ABY4CJ47_9BACL|nr:M48 family metallopeptidase [Alicyclobacillaceae bacterium MYW30-H2]
MRTVYKALTFTYIVYAVGILAYIYTQDPSRVPVYDIGGVSDPTTFMSRAQIHEANAVSRLQYVSFFIFEPLQWIIYFVVLTSGVSGRMKYMTQQMTHVKAFQRILYVIGLLALLFIVHLPINGFYFVIDHLYHLSSQTASSWLGDLLKSFGLDLITQVPLFLGVFWLIKKQPNRWWISIWVLSIPITIFLMFIQPLVVDPIFNTFQPLPDQQLKAEIISLTTKAHIPTDQIYVVNKSKQTNELNAYVTGIGSQTRVVYWDTLLHSMTKGEIVFVTAHEIGHYVLHHIYIGIVVGLLIGYGVLWVFYRLYLWIVQRFKESLHIDGPHDFVALPLLLLLYSVLSFAILPVENAISRTMEHQADQYAMMLTHDKKDAIQSFQMFAKHDLQAVNPPFLVYIFLDDHPTLLQRIDFVAHWKS